MGYHEKFIKENPQYLAENNFMDFISDDKGETYNLCHFWSNFEIANLNFGEVKLIENILII